MLSGIEFFYDIQIYISDKAFFLVFRMIWDGFKRSSDRFYFNLTITVSEVYAEKIPNPPVILENTGEFSEKGFSSLE